MDDGKIIKVDLPDEGPAVVTKLEPKSRPKKRQVQQLSYDGWPEVTGTNYNNELPRRFLFNAKTNDFFDLASRETIPRSALTGLYLNVTTKDAGGKVKAINAADAVLHSPDKTTVLGIGWHPIDAPVIYVGNTPLANTYRAPTLKPASGEPTEWLELMHFIYGEYAELVIQHMAFTVQRPAEKIRWQVMVVSRAKRTGKSSTAAPLKRIFEESHSVISADDIDTGWGDYQFRNKVVIVEELYRPGNKAFFNTIKAGLVNDDFESLNMKGSGVVKQQNIRSYYLFTNHWNAVSFDEDEDKLLVIEAPSKPWGGDFTQYHDEIIQGDLANRVYGYLLSLDVSDFPYAALPVRTEALRKLCEESAPDYQHWMRDALDEQTWPFNRPCIYFEDLRDALRRTGYSRFGNEGIKQELERLGYVNVRAQRRVGGILVKRRIWLPEKLAAIASQAELVCIVDQVTQRPNGEGTIKTEVLDWLTANGFSEWAAVKNPYEKFV